MRTYKVIRGPHFDADTKMVVTDSYYEQLHHLISCKEKNNVILADYLQTALCFFFSYETCSFAGREIINTRKQRKKLQCTLKVFYFLLNKFVFFVEHFLLNMFVEYVLFIFC